MTPTEKERAQIAIDIGVDLAHEHTEEPGMREEIIHDWLVDARLELDRLRRENAELKGKEEAAKRACARILLDYDKATAELFSLRKRVEEKGNRPRIVCFCGSSRFIAQMAVLMWEWEKAGHITLGLHYLPSWYGENRGWGPDFDHAAELEGLADKMDELHKRKIDLADEIYVVNVNGYIGSSTRSEIEYAETHGKPVSYLEARGVIFGS